MEKLLILVFAKLSPKSLLGYISNQLQGFLSQNHSFLDVKITTNRLLVKPISMTYKSEIFQEFTDEITNYMYPCSAKDISETESFIKDSIFGMKTEDHLIVVILKKDSQEFLGCAGIHKINTNYPELGIWLKKSAHGNNYGLETITALKTWAEENLHYKSLVYTVDKRNVPSRKIPEKLGGRIVREYKKTNLSGKVLQLLEYKIPAKSDRLKSLR
jgi:RimJ/RimL family protein N-acetyltransferase